MTVSSAIAPFDLPHKGHCLCAECPWGKWCNYCIMKMEPRPNEFILLNRKRPSAPIFLSRDEAVTVAQGLAQSLVPGKDFGGNRFKAALIECMKGFAEAWGVKQALPLSRYLSMAQQAANNAVEVMTFEPEPPEWVKASDIKNLAQCWYVIGDPTAWPEPDTHDEWRKLNEAE